MKKLIYLALSCILCLSLFGCDGTKVKQTVKTMTQDNEVKIQDKDYTKYEYATKDKEEVSTEVKNLKDYSDQNMLQSRFIDNDDDVDILLKGSDRIALSDKNGSRILSYNELAKEVSEKIHNIEFQGYNKAEKLMFNYTHASELQLNGIYITENVETVRKADQFYRDSQRTVGKNSFHRYIEAIKYKNKANLEALKGTFETREKNKNVNIEWEEIEWDTKSKDIQNFIDNIVIDFGIIKQFYNYDNDYNFEAKCKGSLRDFVNWCTVENSATKTLLDVTAEVTQEVMEQGVKKEKQVKVAPLKSPFEYDLKVSKDDKTGDVTYTIHIDEEQLTKALSTYYKIFQEYDIVNASYDMTIVKYKNQEESKEEIVENEATQSEISTSNVASSSDITNK